MPVMVDLCAGRGGASQAMVERGWEVHRVELAPQLQQTELGGRVTLHRADVRTWKWAGGAVDLVWGSPPCQEFTRTALPWVSDAPAPDMTLVFAVLGQIATLRPRWWAIENVKGAIPWFTPWLGPPAICAAPLFLWGRLPLPQVPRLPRKERISGGRPDLRSRIPYAVSEAVAAAIERAA
jgi:hypothetical protein